MKKLLAFAFVSALFLNACVRGTETFERKPAEKSYAIEDIKTTAEDEFPKWIGMWQSMIPDFDVSQMTGSDLN
jgi:PBP1b-binding outer membrane lipoprotein LpoB